MKQRNAPCPPSTSAMQRKRQGVAGEALGRFPFPKGTIIPSFKGIKWDSDAKQDWDFADFGVTINAIILKKTISNSLQNLQSNQFVTFCVCFDDLVILRQPLYELQYSLQICIYQTLPVCTGGENKNTKEHVMCVHIGYLTAPHIAPRVHCTHGMKRGENPKNWHSLGGDYNFVLNSQLLGPNRISWSAFISGEKSIILVACSSLANFREF